jgi:hypothetical protein
MGCKIKLGNYDKPKLWFATGSGPEDETKSPTNIFSSKFHELLDKNDLLADLSDIFGDSSRYVSETTTLELRRAINALLT